MTATTTTTAETTGRFHWTAYTADGEKRKGTDLAASPEALRKVILSRDLRPATIESASSGLNREVNLNLRKRPKVEAVSAFATQMATYLDSGVSILQALEDSAQGEDPILNAALVEACGKVERGVSLSSAMADHPLVFSSMTVSMIRAGETGGFLSSSFEHVASSLTKEVKLRRDVKSALAYPAVVIAIAILAIIAMLWKVLPTMAALYDDIGGAELPAPTRFVMALSDSMFVWLPLLLVASVATSVWYSRHRDDERVREVVDATKVRIPGVGKLFRSLAVARFTRNLSMLTESKVSLVSALEMTAKTVGNIQVERAILRAADSVSRGGTIADQLRTEPLFPRMVVTTVATGQATGNVGHVLVKAAEFYEAEVDGITNSIKSVIEPILIAGIGVVIGGMVIAMYLPYFNIGQLISQNN